MKNGHIGPLTFQHCQMWESLAPHKLHRLEFLFVLAAAPLSPLPIPTKIKPIGAIPMELETKNRRGVRRAAGRTGAGMLLLLLSKFMLHYTASYNASKFGVCVTKVDVGNKLTSKGMCSSPNNLSVPIYNNNIKKKNKISGKQSPNAEKIGHPKSKKGRAMP